MQKSVRMKLVQKTTKFPCGKRFVPSGPPTWSNFCSKCCSQAIVFTSACNWWSATDGMGWRGSVLGRVCVERNAAQGSPCFFLSHNFRTISTVSTDLHEVPEFGDARRRLTQLRVRRRQHHDLGRRRRQELVQVLHTRVYLEL